MLTCNTLVPFGTICQQMPKIEAGIWEQRIGVSVLSGNGISELLKSKSNMCKILNT